jgi:hypothetical protein
VKHAILGLTSQSCSQPSVARLAKAFGLCSRHIGGVRSQKMEQSIHDDAVVAEWLRRRSEFRRAQRPLVYGLVVLFVCLLVPPLFGIIKAMPYIGVLLFIGVWLASYLRTRHQIILMCPHCNRTPVSKYGQYPIFELDHCPHCLYWLKTPWTKLSK